MTNENYTIAPLVLAQTGAVPDDATAVVVAGPKTDFFEPEIEALKAYLDKQGKLLLELDPPLTSNAAPLTNLVALAHDWGFDVGRNVVVDVSGMGRLFGANESVPVAANYPSHPITEQLQADYGVPAGAIGRSGDGRREWAYAAGVRRDQPAKLGRDGLGEPHLGRRGGL